MTESNNNMTEISNTMTENNNMITESSNTMTESGNMMTESSNTMTESNNMITESSNTMTESGNNTMTKSSNNTMTESSNNTMTESNNIMTESNNNMTEISNNMTENNNDVMSNCDWSSCDFSEVSSSDINRNFRVPTDDGIPLRIRPFIPRLNKGTSTKAFIAKLKMNFSDKIQSLKREIHILTLKKYELEERLKEECELKAKIKKSLLEQVEEVKRLRKKIRIENLKKTLKRKRDKKKLMIKREKVNKNIFEIKEIPAHILAPLFDCSMTVECYDHLRRIMKHYVVSNGQRKRKTPLPSYSSINRFRRKVNETILEWNPTIQCDGIELGFEEVLSMIGKEKKWAEKKRVTVCIGDDARLLSKGLKGTAAQTLVCVSERGSDVPLSVNSVFRVALLWGKEKRQMLRRSLSNLIAYLNTREEKGKTRITIDDCTVDVDIHYCADLMAMDEIFPNKGCPFCDWEPGTHGNSLNCIKNPNEIPQDALFSLPRKNIRFCCLHCCKRIVENLITLMVREWSKGSDGNDITSDLKSERRQNFEKFIDEHKIYAQYFTLENSSKQH
jgi:hypothetical protein